MAYRSTPELWKGGGAAFCFGLIPLKVLTLYLICRSQHRHNSANHRLRGLLTFTHNMKTSDLNTEIRSVQAFVPNLQTVQLLTPNVYNSIQTFNADIQPENIQCEHSIWKDSIRTFNSNIQWNIQSKNVECAHSIRFMDISLWGSPSNLTSVFAVNSSDLQDMKIVVISFWHCRPWLVFDQEFRESSRTVRWLLLSKFKNWHE